MTENEAIEILGRKTRKQVLYQYEALDRPYVIAQAEHIAIKALQEIQQYRAIGTVKECKAAAEKQKYHGGGWIPCEDRMPEESLNSVIGWDKYRKRSCLVQYWGGRWILGNDIDSVNIVAWQPLPEPYNQAT